MPKKKLSPIITDSYVSPELNSRASVGCSAAAHKAVNPLDAYRVTDRDRWQRVHDAALDYTYQHLTSDGDMDVIDDALHIAEAASYHLRRLRPKAYSQCWAKVKAYWQGL